MRTTGIEFAEKGKMRMVDLGEPPELAPTQVLLETKYTAITNGTERHAFLIEHGYGGGAFPSRHGYQHVGEVVAVGEAVQTLAIGDWLYCGDYVGHRGWHVVDEHGLVSKLPDTMDRKYCALFGVAGVALRSVRRMGVGAGDNVWVVGQGPIGHFTAQAARAVGARVTVTDMIENRLEAARACGELQLREAVIDLEELADDVDSAVQEATLWSLGQIGGNRAREILQRYVNSDDEATSAAAEAALNELEFLCGDLGDLFSRLTDTPDEVW